VTRSEHIIEMGLLCVACVLATGPSACGGPADRAEIFDLFSEAKQLFRRANELMAKDPEGAEEVYREAAMRFERIAEAGGIRNGKLYYNIGNTYFRMGDIGRAILYYRRAERLIPNDPNLRQNLSFARRKRLDKIEEAQRTKVLKTLFFWHYDLSARTRMGLFAFFFATLWVCASARLFARRTLLTWAIAISAVLAVVLFGSLVVEELSNRRDVAGVILTPEVVARKGDSETYQPSFKDPLHAGTEFELLEDRGDWYHIELADGRRCWIPARAAGLVRPGAQSAA